MSEQPDFHDRVLPREFPRQEQQKRNSGDRREENDEIRVEPIFTLTFIKNNFQTAKRERDENEPDPVDPQSVPQELSALAFENFRFCDQPLNKNERDHADRRVNEKDPMPREIVGDPAA